MHAGEQRSLLWRVAMLVAALAVAALIYGEWRSGVDTERESVSQVSPESLSVWYAEWDWEDNAGEAERVSRAASIASIQAFGAYFDGGDKLYFRNDFVRMAQELQSRNRGGELYMSIVNDVIGPSGAASSLKDSDLLHRLVDTADSRRAHIADIMDAVSQYGFDGVEIDYENIADNDWPAMSSFYEELHAELKREGLPLRVVLEPKAPVDKHVLPAGPAYVMMAYNLYGTHSGPGPKADLSLIGRVAAKLEHVPGDGVIAFSAGGFAWNEAGKATALRELEAVELSLRALEPTTRDPDSGAVHFRYTDENGERHTVWYADAGTLRGWAEAAGRRGIAHIALWRLGGLSEETLDYLSRL